MNISCVHRDIPQDLTLAAEESSHPPLPHLVILTIKVWRTLIIAPEMVVDWLLVSVSLGTQVDRCDRSYRCGRASQITV
jgi:hypothetical protein